MLYSSLEKSIDRFLNPIAIRWQEVAIKKNYCGSFLIRNYQPKAILKIIRVKYIQSVKGNK